MDNSRRKKLIAIVVKNVYTQKESLQGIDFRNVVYSDCFSYIEK